MLASRERDYFRKKHVLLRRNFRIQSATRATINISSRTTKTAALATGSAELLLLLVLLWLLLLLLLLLIFAAPQEPNIFVAKTRKKSIFASPATSRSPIKVREEKLCGGNFRQTSIMSNYATHDWWIIQ